MKKTILPLVYSFLLLALFVSGCGPGQPLGPAITPSPTDIPTATLTPTPAPTPTPAATPTAATGEIKGIVLDPDGKPVKICTLVLVGDKPNALSAKTDAQGQYSFSGVEPGAYSIQYTAMLLNEKGDIGAITIANTDKFEVKAGAVVQVDINAKLSNQ